MLYITDNYLQDYGRFIPHPLLPPPVHEVLLEPELPPYPGRLGDLFYNPIII
jgi:hypothetical protein